MSHPPPRPAAAAAAAAPPASGGGLLLAPSSASASEKDASTSPAATHLAPPERRGGAGSASKLRSCVVCRSRKVRCDKQSPCSNCRRAGIACVVPSSDRPPKWARRLERLTNAAAAATGSGTGTGTGTGTDAGGGGSVAAAPSAENGAGQQVLERLRALEGLVKDLSGQLEQANAAVASSTVNSPGSSSQGGDQPRDGSTPSSTGGTGVSKQFGRLVVKDQSQSRYVSSGFWSRVSDELDGLKASARGLASSDSDSSEETPGTTPSTRELGRTPSDRHGFLFAHNLGTEKPDLRAFRPLPSQIPFLLDTFLENINFIVQIVHMPTIRKMVREARGDTSSLGSSNEAVLFAIYYAAVASMDEEDVTTNFGLPRSDLALKYRLGLEHSLAQADFCTTPNILLVQAFTIFLLLVRLNDSPRFVWMMTGLAIRMAQSIGLHRDGAHFPNLTPFEVEMRRRVWAALCMLDIRASENQGSDLTISTTSFDTKLPLNINDEDISPETKDAPQEREGLTDMSFPIVSYELCHTTMQMMALGHKGDASSLEQQSRLLDNFYERVTRSYLRFSVNTGNIAYWVGSTSTRLVVAKLTLIIYLPSLLSPSPITTTTTTSPSVSAQDDATLRDRLLVAAIEVAEYNHALNSEPRARQWRWVYQTYTHWYAVVYLLLEINRRPSWTPIAERAWQALHSAWLVPAGGDASLPIWVPLKRLMARARRRRAEEVGRLRRDGRLAREVEGWDRGMPVPGSEGWFGEGKGVDGWKAAWRVLVHGSEGGEEVQTGTSRPREHGPQDVGMSRPESTPNVHPNPNPFMQPTPGQHNVWPNLGYTPETTASDSSATHAGVGPGPPQVPADWTGFGSWLWAPDEDQSADAFAGLDVNMDLDGDMDWNTWLESAAGAEMGVGGASEGVNWGMSGNLGA